jgi:branched-chain amino acid transport system substrate-binding protein
MVDQWEIPFLNAWTGPAAGYGKLVEFFAQAAVDDINAEGGIAGIPLVLNKCDTAMDPTRAASCMKKAAEKSIIILGPMTSLATQVCAPIAAQQKVLAIPATGGAETIKKSRPWSVVVMPTNASRAAFGMNVWLDKNPDIKRVVMLNFPKVAQWKKLVELRKEALAERGVETVEVIDVQAGAVDVSSVVVRTLKAKPDGIVTSLMPADTVRIIQELEKRGFTNKSSIFNHQTVDTPEMYTLSAESGGVMNGTFISTLNKAMDNPAYQKLLTKFQTLEGQEKATALMWGECFYIAAYMIKDAIEGTGITGDPAKLGEERAALRDYINGMKEFDSRIRGKMAVLEDGSMTLQVYVGVVEDNKLNIIADSDTYKK